MQLVALLALHSEKVLLITIPPYSLSEVGIEMAGADWRVGKTQTTVANIQRKLDLVSWNLTDFEEIAREQLRLGYEIHHEHARRSRAHVFQCRTLGD